MVVLFIFVSIAYDIAWFVINNDAEDDDDGGVERGVKRFARNISYISFVWKVSVLFLISLLIYLYFDRSSLALFSGRTHLTTLQSLSRLRHQARTRIENSARWRSRRSSMTEHFSWMMTDTQLMDSSCW